MPPIQKSVKRVLAGPAKIDGNGVCRWAEYSDGTAGVEAWRSGAWAPASGVTLDEIGFGRKVSQSDLRSA
jgi:hypothetical protein